MTETVDITVGPQGVDSTTAVFEYAGQRLVVYTGIDKIAWGYSMETASFDTYGGQVTQILGCYVGDMELEGTLSNYEDMQKTYDFFLRFITKSGGGGTNAAGQPQRSDRTMLFTYGPRRWVFDLIVKELPGYRQAFDTVAPTWKIKAHVVNTAGDVEQLSDLIITEARFKDLMGKDENFQWKGQIGFTKENPFSDPITDYGDKFNAFDKVADYYSTLLPSYMSGDFDAMFSQIGSTPAFSPEPGAKGVVGQEGIKGVEAAAAKRGKEKKGNG